MKFVSSETFMLQGEVGGTPKVFVEFFVPPAQIPIGDVLRLSFHREGTLLLERASHHVLLLYHQPPLPWALSPANVGTRYPFL